MALPLGFSVLIAILLGPLLGTLAWGFWRTRHEEAAKGVLGGCDDLLLAFLLLAAVSFGAFLVFLLLTTGG